MFSPVVGGFTAILKVRQAAEFFDAIDFFGPNSDNSVPLFEWDASSFTVSLRTQWQCAC